jgi:hypothetical protein
LGLRKLSLNLVTVSAVLTEDAKEENYKSNETCKATDEEEAPEA